MFWKQCTYCEYTYCRVPHDSPRSLVPTYWWNESTLPPEPTPLDASVITKNVGNGWAPRPIREVPPGHFWMETYHPPPRWLYIDSWDDHAEKLWPLRSLLYPNLARLTP